MPTYEVQCGEIEGYFKASSPENAFIKALRRVQKVKDKKVPVPGILLRIRKVDNTFKPLSEWQYLNPLELIKKL